MARTTITITPRFYETDALGHINNATIAAWLEVSRMSFTGSMLEGTRVSSVNWMLAAVNIDFVDETFFGSDVEARITAARPGNSSLTIEHELWQGERLTVRGKSVLVYLDGESRRSAPLPQPLREKLAQAGLE